MHLATYEVGILTTGVTNATPACEFVAGSGKPMSILEMGIFLNAATATTLTLGRPGNTPTTGTPQTGTLPTTLGNSLGVSVGGIVLSGWGTTPTVPAAGNSFRMLQLAAAIGNGVVWNWEEGEMVVSPTRSSGLVLWNVSTNSALRLSVKWTE